MTANKGVQVRCIAVVTIEVLLDEQCWSGSTPLEKVTSESEERVRYLLEHGRVAIAASCTGVRANLVHGTKIGTLRKTEIKTMVAEYKEPK